MPEISVIMGAFREREDHIRLAIESILNQTFSNFEFIIILDDPKNDALAEVISEYEHLDSRVLFLKNENNLGLAETLNKGIAIARGKYIARMDADDFSFPERFDKQIEFMEKNPETMILGTNKILIDEEGNIVGKAGPLPTSWVKIKKILSYGNILVHPSIMFRTEAIRKMGGYRNIALVEDSDLWFRCVCDDVVIRNIDEYLIKYRINYQGVSLSQSYKQAAYGRYAKKLFNERKKTGHDSFSKDKMEKYIAQFDITNPKEIEKYGTARKTFENARIMCKNKKYFSGITGIIKAFTMHQFIRRMIVRNMYSFIFKRVINDK